MYPNFYPQLSFFRFQSNFGYDWPRGHSRRFLPYGYFWISCKALATKTFLVIFSVFMFTSTRKLFLIFWKRLSWSPLYLKLWFSFWVFFSGHLELFTVIIMYFNQRGVSGGLIIYLCRASYFVIIWNPCSNWVIFFIEYIV